MALITVVHFSPVFEVLLLFFYFYPPSLSTYFPLPHLLFLFFLPFEAVLLYSPDWPSTHDDPPGSAF